MTYLFEREMVPDLTASLPGLFGKGQEYAHACEVPDGSRVVDIVFADIPDPCRMLEDCQYYAKGFTRLSNAQVFVLAIIWRVRRITVAKLSSMTWTSGKVIRGGYINPLADLGLIRRSGQKSYEPTEWSKWEPMSVITVEAKLTDWRCALEQASDNKRRSDFSYIAFPAVGLARRKEVLDETKAHGIGIIEVNPNADPTIVLNAKRVRRSKDPQRWAFYLRILIELISMNDRWTLVTT
jgi:hypothetical protein